MIDPEADALATLVVRGRAWLEVRARGADTTAAGVAVDTAMAEFRRIERRRRKAEKRARKSVPRSP